jgi:hypothetical protein
MKTMCFSRQRVESLDVGEEPHKQRERGSGWNFRRAGRHGDGSSGDAVRAKDTLVWRRVQAAGSGLLPARRRLPVESL